MFKANKMADDSSMKKPATTEDIARVTLTASVRYRMIAALITDLQSINPFVSPAKAQLAMSAAADELEQLIGGARE